MFNNTHMLQIKTFLDIFAKKKYLEVDEEKEVEEEKRLINKSAHEGRFFNKNL